MQRIDYFLVAYSLETELQVAADLIPDALLPQVRAAASIGAADWNKLECWPLTSGQAREVARLVGRCIGGADASYFVEARVVEH